MVLDILLNSELSVTEKILQIIFCVLAVVLALSIHESSHGLAALAMGDDTAKNQGRITLNPFKHMDLTGAIMLFVIGFGWASPVQINPNNFKHRKAGTIVTSLAGPVSNLLFALIGTFLYLLTFGFYIQGQSGVVLNIMYFFSIFTSINIGLAVFNLIPSPPLDGSKVVAECLPFNAKYKYLSLERYSFIFFIVLILLLRYFNFISAISGWIFNLFFSITEPLVSLFF